MTDFAIEVLDDKAALIDRSTALTVEWIDRALAVQPTCSIALSGGSTPRPLYAALGDRDLPWDRLHVFWGDERYVPADHPDSNQRMAREAWLDRVPLPPENLHPMPTDGGDPAADANRYARHLQAAFGLADGEFPALDINLLGLGDDGHTASLFPHTDALAVRDRAVAVGNKDGQPRLTLTVPVLARSARTMFLVAGRNKRDALRQVFDPADDATLDSTYPARLVRPAGELRWLLDREAGEPFAGGSG